MKIYELTTDLKLRRKRLFQYTKQLFGGLSEKIPSLSGTRDKIYEKLKTVALVLYLYRFLIFFPVAIVYMEVVFKIAIFKTLFNSGFIYMVFYSIPAGLLLYIFSTFSKRKFNRIISIALTATITLIYLVQAVYYHVFTAFFALFSLNGAGQVMQFWREILTAIGENSIAILFLLLPLIFIIIFGNKLIPPDKSAWSFKAILACLVLILQIVTTAVVFNSDDGELSPKFLYSEAVIPDLSVDRFGLLTTTRLDLKHLVFSFNVDTEITGNDNENTQVDNKLAPPAEEDALATDTSSGLASGSSNSGSLKRDSYNEQSISNRDNPEQNTNPENESTHTGLNIMNIDFDKLMAAETDPKIDAMHKYFMSVQPTNKNKYSGMYKGKNLIFITAEGFSPYAVNRELTPTLYKMSQEGFQFTNFYTPIWGVSTSDGEYVACNSLVPKSGVWSFYVSGRNYMPFCMGNQLKKLGYGTRAYHDHSYTYYHRDVSHPNMGYDFKAVGHGLELNKSWPESDVEMIEKTASEYLGTTPFHTYYMTVSGHLQYTFGGNAMASKNKELVKNLSYSEHVKAYLACQIEFDRAMGKLIAGLEEAGVAENTLIAISPDHYPYGLTIEEISELAGHKIEENFELYKGIFILWSKGMTTVKIDKPCSSMDILPTISNLMGVEYDSRLLMGRDIMSDAPPLVIFSNWSWLTDKARYNSKQRKLILEDGQTEATVNAAYKADIAKQVNNKFTYSTKILDTNYYAKVFSK